MAVYSHACTTQFNTLKALLMTPLALNTPELVWPAGAVLGESPVWCGHRKILYWVDIKGLKLHAFAPETGTRRTWEASEPIGCITAPDARDIVLAATQSGFAALQLGDTGKVFMTPILSPEADTLPGNRFNDGKRAPDGSFWAGTMDNAEEADTGSWWRLEVSSGTATQLDSGYRVTNGPAFDAARSRVYLTDSARQTVFVADWISGGGFTNKRVFLQFKPGEGYPDGMQVYSDGSLWIAFWDGACLRRFSPDGQLIQSVDLPVQRPTSLAFAPDRNEIYITSASTGLDAADEWQGGLLRVSLS